MQALIEITPWYWVGFIACVLIFLALDLGLFHRESRAVTFREALTWTLLWFAMAMAFGGALAVMRSHHEAVEFCTGYFIELSLSLDNVLVIALIFIQFNVPITYQHRVLFWGIIGALIMRGVMIWVGVALITRFEWMLYVFGAFILLAGVKMLLTKNIGGDPEKSFVLRIAQKMFRITPEMDGQKLVTRFDGRCAFTPLFLVLLLVETGDLLFAVDSIPAVFGVTRNAYIVFTSNVFAILGLRSLYFVLAGAMNKFRYLKTGLAAVLVLIGAKMLIDPHGQPPKWFQREMPVSWALVMVVIVVGISILISLMAARREKENSTPRTS